MKLSYSRAARGEPENVDKLFEIIRRRSREPVGEPSCAQT